MKTRKTLWTILILLVIFIVILVFNYNIPIKIESEEFGVFIDYSSETRGVELDKCHLDAIDETIPGEKTNYWFGCHFNNYSSPIFLRIYFPSKISISSYGSCQKPINLEYGKEPKFGEPKCFSFNAQTKDENILEIIYNNESLPYEQIQISTSIFSKETPERYLFKSFQIRSNPLPFIDGGKLIEKNPDFDISLKIKRNEYTIQTSDSNFIPSIENSIQGDFNYQRVIWNMAELPGEGIFYIIKNKESKNKQLINLFGVLILGAILGILIDKKLPI